MKTLNALAKYYRILFRSISEKNVTGLGDYYFPSELNSAEALKILNYFKKFSIPNGADFNDLLLSEIALISAFTGGGDVDFVRIINSDDYDHFASKLAKSILANFTSKGIDPLAVLEKCLHEKKFELKPGVTVPEKPDFFGLSQEEKMVGSFDLFSSCSSCTRNWSSGTSNNKTVGSRETTIVPYASASTAGGGMYNTGYSSTKSLDLFNENPLRRRLDVSGNKDKTQSKGMLTLLYRYAEDAKNDSEDEVFSSARPWDLLQRDDIWSRKENSKDEGKRRDDIYGREKNWGISSFSKERCLLVGGLASFFLLCWKRLRGGSGNKEKTLDNAENNKIEYELTGNRIV